LAHDRTPTPSRESVELFLQAPGQSRYYQFVASLDGYHYDSAGEEKSWNGTGEFAIKAADDRWFLEMRHSRQGLGHRADIAGRGVAPDLCCNQQSGLLHVATVGPNFHNRRLSVSWWRSDFGTWRGQQPRRREPDRERRSSERLNRNPPIYSDRLAAI